MIKIDNRMIKSGSQKYVMIEINHEHFLPTLKKIQKKKMTNIYV